MAAAAAAAAAATIDQMHLKETSLWKIYIILWIYVIPNLLQNHAHENSAIFAVNFHAETFQFEFSW